MKFTKMQGAGNDYVYIDCMKEKTIASMTKPELSLLAKTLSNRNYAIGSDGIILIKEGNDAEFMMEMYNSDGSQAEMCGNGLRCVVKFLYDERYNHREDMLIETGAGVLSTRITEVNSDDKVTRVNINMGKPKLKAKEIPVIWKKEADDKHVIDEKLPVHGHHLKFTAVSMGNPHCVIFMADREGLNNLNIKHYGGEIEMLEMFPNRTNVEFVYAESDVEVYQRTWERGSGETLACGTGACASIVAGVLTDRLNRRKVILNHLKGGELMVEWSEADDCVYLEGEAVRVFDGEWLL
jgi:diaminopimelate epimerase